MPEQTSIFISPRLTGKRFNDHLMPLDLLEDFAALEDLLLSVAKKIYLAEHPARKIAPKSLTDGVSLKLEKVDEGSAILKIWLVINTLLNVPQQPTELTTTYFERAKNEVFAAIDAAYKNETIVSEFIDKDDLLHFRKVGNRLREDEAIDFSPNSENYTAILDRRIRHRILEASVHNNDPRDAKIRASVASLNKEKGIFTLSIVGGGNTEISTAFSPAFYNLFIESFERYETGQKILIFGTAKYNKANKIEEIVSVQSVSILDPLDVPSRLWELSSIKNGWLDGEIGSGINKRGISKLSDLFDLHFDHSLPLPHVYPTVDGNIQAEWSTDTSEVSLEITLSDLRGLLHDYNVSSKEYTEFTFDLHSEAGWNSLNQTLSTTLSH